MTPPCKIRNPEYIGSWTDGLVIRFVIQKVIRNVTQTAPTCVFTQHIGKQVIEGVLSSKSVFQATKKPPLRTVKSKWWWEMDSNHRSQRQQIYSLPPLAARESHQMERVKGIEPSRSAWKADVLPLNYTRKFMRY